MGGGPIPCRMGFPQSRPPPHPCSHPRPCRAGTGPKELQPWLISLTAVVVFLFIVFVLLLINRLWQIRMRRKQGGLQDTQGTDRLEHAGCANPAAEKDSDEESDGEEQSKATSL
ncbi:small integral membrane protein 24 isoform X1 [Aquila chrysaetos chrysaetos]|uniref:small integral membrane protein 24 isoform X1 n=1 Tax=Aquila chrysaetos chrysaetos TaxID=223781 RepID=UPI0011770D93|nr:small integral membrane protein 24 isoform X1 [Aquila chrysaetos chrysaetos]